MFQIVSIESWEQNEDYWVKLIEILSELIRPWSQIMPSSEHETSLWAMDEIKNDIVIEFSSNLHAFVIYMLMMKSACNLMLLPEYWTNSTSVLLLATLEKWSRTSEEEIGGWDRR